MAYRVSLSDLLYQAGRIAAIVFIVFLSIAAAVLALGDEKAANILAEYAYYSLVAAVAANLAAVVVEERGGGPRLEIRLPKPSTLALALSTAVAVAGYTYAAHVFNMLVTPGRPTIVYRLGSGIDTYLRILVGVLGVLEAAYGYRRSILLLASGLAAISGALLGGAAGGVAVLAAATVSMLHDWRSSPAYASAAAAAIAALGYVFSARLEAVGWGILASSTLTALVLGFGSSIALLARPTAGRVVEAGGGNGGRLGLALLSLAVAVAVAGPLLPRTLYGQGIYSLDTVFNKMFCARLARGDLTVFYEWRRPLYTLIATLPASMAGCRLEVFDIALPVAGLVALAVTVYILAVRSGLGGLWAGLASLLSTLYWTPFFTYAGLQTNLLTLPIALAALKLSLEDGVRRAAPLWLAVGLLHPWSLAFYTASLAVAVLAERGAGWRRRLVAVLASTTPGWAAYGVVELLAHGFSVGAVAYSAIARPESYVWSITIYFWGTGMRGDILLPASLALAAATLGRERLPSWIAAPMVTAFIASLAPNTRLIPRYLVDSTAPILVAYVLARRRSRGVAVAQTAASTIILLLYLLHEKPVAAG